MVYLLVGFLLIWLSLGGLRAFAQASPAALARLIKRSGGAAALAIAGLLAVARRGRARLGFAGLGFWLLNVGGGGVWQKLPSPPPKGLAQWGRGQAR